MCGAKAKLAWPNQEAGAVSITYSVSRNVSARKIQALFRRLEWFCGLNLFFFGYFFGIN